MNHNKFNTAPTNASGEFAQSSRNDRDRGKIENVLDSEAAAYAAKPFMDVAVEAYNTRKAMWDIGEGEGLDRDDKGNPQELIDYAEKRAHQAALGERDPGLTRDEEVAIDAYKAQAAMEQAMTAGEGYIQTENDVMKAQSVALDRASEARRRGDKEEAQRWRKIADQTGAYGAWIFESDEDAKRQVLPDIGASAGYITTAANRDGWVQAEFKADFNNTPRDTINMHTSAEMFNLFAELQQEQQAEPAPTKEASPVVPKTEVNEIVKRGYEMDEARYTAEIDPEVLEDGEFMAVSTTISKMLRQSKDNPDELKKWQSINQGFGAYRRQWQNEGDMSQLPTDMKELMNRRNFKEYLASVYPKPEESRTEAERPIQRIDVAESRADAKQMIDTNPELLGELFREASAYNAFTELNKDTLFPNRTEQADVYMKIFTKKQEGFGKAMEAWRRDSKGFTSFNEYTAAVNNGDLRVSDELEAAVSDARVLMKNKSWTERLFAMTTKMSKRDTNKSELDRQKPFADWYFNQ